MRNHRTRQLITIFTAAIIGVVLGLLIKNSLGLADVEVLPSANASDAANPKLTAISKTSIPNEQGVRKALSLESRSKRLLWFATQAEHADGEQMARLMRLAGGDVPITKMLGAHWARLDPQHMFDTLAANFRAGAKYDHVLVYTLCEEWAESDPDALIAAFDDENAFPAVTGARMNVSDILMRTDPEQGLGVMERWGVRHYIPRMHKVAEWAKSDPRNAAERVAAINADRAGIEALGAVGAGWAEVDPVAALEFSNGLSGQKRQQFVESAMKVWARNDLGAAIAFASGHPDPAFRGMIGAGLLAEWGKQDPAAALNWAQANLKSQLRSKAIGKLVGSLAVKDLKIAQDLVSGLDAGGTQFIAAKQLADTWIEKSGAKSISKVAAWLATLPDEKIAQRALNDVSWRINTENPEALANLLGGENGHLVTGYSLRQAVESQVRKSPTAALDWARGLPGGRTEETEQSVLRTWVDLQPAAASDWSISAPAGASRDYAIDNIARSYLHRSAKELRPWMEKLSDGEQSRVREIVGNLRPGEEQKQKLAAALAD